MLTIKRDSTEWRILLELEGRAAPVTLRDLCETLGLEPGDAANAMTNLWLGDRTKRDYSGADSETWRITWQGQDALRRLDEPEPQPSAHKRHWWTRRTRATKEA